MSSVAIPTSHVPNVRELEIHATYRCNMRCYNCATLVSQAPSNEDMPPEHLKKLLDDSVALNWPWTGMGLHGGESTLHPQFEELCRLMADYKAKHNPTCAIRVFSNGYGDYVQKQHEIATRHGLTIGNSYKQGPRDIGHITFGLSPEDAGEPYHLGCFQSSSCGIAYTVRGFYECSHAGAAWRVFGYPPIVTELKDLTAEKLAEGFKVHCKHCGYARIGIDRRAVVEPTATWKEALDKYHYAKTPDAAAA